METVVIGIDGGEWDVIDPLIDDGCLPNLEGLRQEGISGPLESITPPVSPPAWTSIQTGTNPGKHGIFDFSTFGQDYQRRTINSSDRSAVPFWEVMNDNDESTGLFKVPFTYPPSTVDGFIVTGFPTPNDADDYVEPMSRINQVGPARELFEDWSLQRSGDYEEFRQNLLAVASRQTDIFIDLIEDFETDFSMMVYDGSDRVQHFFWKYFDESHPRYQPDSPHSDAIKSYYEAIDEGIGRILDNVDETCDVIILSDHGFGPLSHDIYIEEVLEREGIVSRKSRMNEQKNSALAVVLKNIWGEVERVGAGKFVKSILPSSWIQFGNKIQDESIRRMNWSETQAFFTTLSGQSIHINLESRFTNGVVTEDQYDEVVERIRESLMSLEHPQTGQQLVKDVFHSKEIFEGEEVKNAPDLIIQTSAKYTMRPGRSESLIKQSMQNGHDRSGDHREEGIIIMSGPSFREGTYDDASVLDIAPTVLQLYGCAIPTVMDGKVMKETFSDDLRNEGEISWTDNYSRVNGDSIRWTSEEESEIEEQLSDMGYL